MINAQPRGDARHLAAVSKRFLTRGVRVCAVASSPLRKPPDFLIIGAKRGGSTSLWNSVVRHPDVAPMVPKRLKIKGTGFFSLNYANGASWYRSHFPTELSRALASRSRGIRPVTGEATPYYLFHPHAAARASQLVPDVKLIVILRDPVARAYSHYRERLRHGVESLSFEGALDAEAERLEGEEERMLADEGYNSFAHEHLSYVHQGRYVDMLSRWLASFDRDQFLFILNEDFEQRNGEEMNKIWRFLGLPPWDPPEIRRFNYHPSEPMERAIEDRLREGFQPYNQRLAELLRIDLTSWNG